MSVIPKIAINKELTSNLQIIVNDVTGVYTPSNTGGYGGPNGNPYTDINKYIFEVFNLYTEESFIQVQSDDILNPQHFNNPSIARIVNKEDVYLDADNFSLSRFADGLYKIVLNAVMNYPLNGDGFAGEEVIVNVSGAKYIYDNYKYISVGDTVYEIQSIIDTTLVLDKPIVESFNEFNPVIRKSIEFILSDEIDDSINLAIANLAKQDKCSSNNNLVDLLSEIQLYNWGIKLSLEAGDIIQAYDYFQLCKKLCARLSY